MGKEDYMKKLGVLLVLLFIGVNIWSLNARDIVNRAIGYLGKPPPANAEKDSNGNPRFTESETKDHSEDFIFLLDTDGKVDQVIYAIYDKNKVNLDRAVNEWKTYISSSFQFFIDRVYTDAKSSRDLSAHVFFFPNDPEKINDGSQYYITFQISTMLKLMKESGLIQ